MEDLNLVVCGDFPDGPIGIFLPNPHQSTVADIRKEVGKKTGLPEREQTIYINGTPIPVEEPLDECEGMRNGAALCLVANPVRLRVQRSDCDSIMELEIPRVELPTWDIQKLRKLIFFKLGLPEDCVHVLLAEGEVLTDKKNILAYRQIKDGCLITITFLETVERYLSPPDFDLKPLQLPMGTAAKNKGLLVKHIGFGTLLGSAYYIRGWTIYVKQLDGTKTRVVLEDHRNTAIFQLKEKVGSALSIPPHQQKLTAGTTVLEDWDEDGKVLLLCNYPSIYDGVTIYLVCLTEGIHVKLRDTEVNLELQISERNVISFPKDLSIRAPKYINIPNPKNFTIKHLRDIMQNCTYGRRMMFLGRGTSFPMHVNSNTSFTYTDNPVSSEYLIVDGCLLSFK